VKSPWRSAFLPASSRHSESAIHLLVARYVWCGDDDSGSIFWRDIGKIGIPAASLKPGRPTPDGRDVMNEHARHRRSRVPRDPSAQLGTARLPASPRRLKWTGCEDTRHSDLAPFNAHILNTT
jgi:hypothetical protein